MGKAARVVVAAAAAVARKVADQLREQADQRRAAEGAEADRLQARWEAGRAAARAQLAPVDERWLQRATPDQAAEAWGTAHAWSSVDPSFRDDEVRLEQGIRDRWGVDVQDLSDEASLRHAADVEREDARDERAAGNADEIAAGGVLVGTKDEVAALEDSSREFSNAETSADAAASLDASADEAGYDSDACREQLSQRAVDSGVDPEVAQGRGRAANANAVPVKGATRRQRTEGKARRRGGDKQKTRSDQLSR